MIRKLTVMAFAAAFLWMGLLGSISALTKQTLGWDHWFDAAVVPWLMMGAVICISRLGGDFFQAGVKQENHNSAIIVLVFWIISLVVTSLELMVIVGPGGSGYQPITSAVTNAVCGVFGLTIAGGLSSPNKAWAKFGLWHLSFWTIACVWASLEAFWSYYLISTLVASIPFVLIMLGRSLFIQQDSGTRQ